MLRHSNRQVHAILDQVLGGLGKKKSASAGDDEDDYIPFKVRFQAWWEGLEPADILTREAQGEASREGGSAKALVIDSKPGGDGDKGPEGPVSRPDVLQRIWGEGCHIPGAVSFTESLVQDCNLEAGMKVLDLNAGLGGAARAIAGSFELTVTGMDTDPELAERGMAMSEDAGQAETAPIGHFDPEDLKLARGTYDCILAREMLFLIGDKLPFLRVLRDALRMRGHLVFTDYVVTDDANTGRETAEWRETEPVPPRPWTTDRYLMVMSELSLEVITFEDISPEFKQMALDAWNSFMQALDKPGITRDFANAMLAEAELWQRRIQLLKSGDIRVLQVHARKKETATMSEW